MSHNAVTGPIAEVRHRDSSIGERPASRTAPGARSAWTRLAFVAVCVAAIVAALVALHNAQPATHGQRVGALTATLAVASLTATVVYLVILAVLHALPTGYSPVRHAVSDYGVGRYQSLFTSALYVSSIGVLALAFALISGVGTPPLLTRDLGYLLLIPLARIGMTLFPTSLEGERISRTGLLHYVFAIAAFTLTYLATSGMTPALRALDPNGWAHAPLGWTAWIVAPALALVVVTMLRPLRRIFGLSERIFLLTTNVWFALAAGLLISRLH
jgi:hypothetical membrane protein